MTVSAVVVAGGRGERLGGQPKQFRDLAGRMVLEWSLQPFERHDAVREIIVVLPPGLTTPPPAFVGNMRTPVRVVVGGERRQDSVAAGVEAVSPGSDVIVIHDAARPFCTVALVDRTIVAAAESGAAIVAVPAQDTLKRARREDGHNVVAETLSREAIFCSQTPQAFRPSVLLDAVALGRSGATGTDEAALAERAGHQVRLVPGDPRNVKITTEADLEAARETMTTRNDRSLTLRVGLGYDLHRLVEGRRLVLGGVVIPGGRGLDGHSDADVVCHAVADAVLGASNAGDIGKLFPDDDPQWKDASSLDLLAGAATRVRERGVVVQNVDIVVITDWPKIRDHSAVMRENLGVALGLDPGRISLKGKTSEGVGAIGRGEAIAVHAVAMVRSGRG